MTIQKLHKRNTSNLQTTWSNIVFIDVLKGAAGANWGSWRAIGGASLSKYLIRPSVFVHFMKMTTQKLHKHNTSNLQESF